MLLFIKPIIAQKQYNVWYFGERAGITFNTNPPSVLTDSKMLTYEGSSGVCDSLGNLLFYTNGDTVWNKNHQLMKNGISPINYQHFSSLQGAIVIQKPDNKNQYYIFCSVSQEGETGVNDKYIRYWLIDMSLENGLGEAIEVNKPLFKNARENVVVTKHANGTEIWVGGTDDNETTFNCVQTINGVLSNEVISSGIKVNFGVKSAKFSPNSNLLVAGRRRLSTNNFAFSLFHFNNSTGKLSDSLEINTKDALPYFQEFSHDSRYLYMTFTNKNMIIQYDLSIWNKDSIEKSGIIIYQGGNGERFSGIQLGPDKKIYVFKGDSRYISVIDSPFNKGLGCHFLPNPIFLESGINRGGGTYYPTFYFAELKHNLGNDIIICEGDSTILKSKVPLNAKIRWNTGDTTASITVKEKGLYWATAILYGDTAIDTIKVSVGQKPTVFIGSDTAFCGKFSHLLNAGEGKKSYNWSTNDTTFSVLVNQPGMYAVTVKDSVSCENADTIQIEQLLPPNLSVVLDTVTCKDAIISIAPVQAGIQYKWNTGDTTTSIKVNSKGIYTITASNQFCSITQSTVVSMLPMPIIELGVDTNLCQLNGFELTCNDGDRFLWSTGETTRSIIAYQQGKYWVTAERNNCIASDTINITNECDMTYYIPNAFTPNGDNINDVFKVIGQNISFLKMEIYNRWGEKLFESSGSDIYWDGKFEAKQCPQGVYIYSITLIGYMKQVQVEKNLTGNVTLLK